MKTYFYIVLSILIISSCTQDSSIESESSSFDLNGKWILHNSTIFDSIINFRKETFVDSNSIWLKQFTFTDTTLSYEAIKTIRGCGNGIFYLDTIIYNRDNDSIYFSLKGGYTFGSKFLYEAKYLIKNEQDSSFSLIRNELILDDRKAHF